MRLGDAITNFLNARIGIVSKKTARINKQYLQSMVEFFGAHQMLHSISLQHLRAWRTWLNQKDKKYDSGNTWHPIVPGAYSVYTIHGMVRTCRQFFKWLYVEGILETNPAARLELPPLPKAPPKAIREEDIQKMLDVVRAFPRDFALVHFLRDTGCRLGGAASARLSDLDLENGVVILREKGRGGQHVARAAFLNPAAVTALRMWLDVRPNALTLEGKPVTDCIFVNSRYPFGALTEGAIYRRIKNIAKAAGVLDRSNPHAFRHGLARRMLKNGAPLGAVSRVLGHSDIKVTDQYYGVYVSSELKEAHARWA